MASDCYATVTTGLCQCDLCRSPGRPNRIAGSLTDLRGGSTNKPLSVPPYSFHWGIEGDTACKHNTNTLCMYVCVREEERVCM